MIKFMFFLVFLIIFMRGYQNGQQHKEPVSVPPNAQSAPKEFEAVHSCILFPSLLPSVLH